MVEVSAAQHTLYGVEPGWSFAIRHRVRWSECDPFGHANHRAYFEWFEEARNRYLEAVGLAALSPNLPGPVIAETSSARAPRGLSRSAGTAVMAAISHDLRPGASIAFAGPIRLA